MGKSNTVNNSEDLWLDFLKDAPEADAPAANEWTDRYECRPSPLALDLDGDATGK